MEGVLLAFRNERVLTQAATIHPYFPFVRLEVAAEVVVFRPRPGMRLGAWAAQSAVASRLLHVACWLHV